MKLAHLALAVALGLFSAVTFAEAIDINTATAKELEKGVHGLGAIKAAAIVKYREVNGPFKSVEDLTKVKGIKAKQLEALQADKRNSLVVGEAKPAADTATDAPASTEVAPAAPVTPAAPAAPATPVAPASTEVAPAAPVTPAPAKP